ncbi:hypothetical protein [Pectobacterium phage PcCB7V]|nr:hypothetical protein [Pectobacterium phage PcCB7V]
MKTVRNFGVVDVDFDVVKWEYVDGKQKRLEQLTCSKYCLQHSSKIIKSANIFKYLIGVATTDLLKEYPYVQTAYCY